MVFFMKKTDNETDELDVEDPRNQQPGIVRTLPSSTLFGADREIWIEHDGTRYRLRITKRNKLILQK